MINIINTKLLNSHPKSIRVRQTEYITSKQSNTPLRLRSRYAKEIELTGNADRQVVVTAFPDLDASGSSR